MNWLEQLLPPALVRALGWTLVHSLWQGAVVALALAGLLLLLRQHSAEVRYRTATLGLLVLLLLAGVTFGRYYTAATPAPDAAVAGDMAGDEAALSADGLVSAATTAPQAAEVGGTGAASAVVLTTGVPRGLQVWLTYFDQNIPALVALWLLGLLAMTLRLLGGLAYVQRLRRYRVQPLGQEWQERLAALASRAGLQQPVELLESALVRVPVVVGHLRPVVLLPLGTVTGLSTAYLEAILAHELAHVQRRDYLMNLLQSVAEILFFYHPAVWFITACLRTERENCCDDAATALVGGNPLTVARALAALAELSVAPEPGNQLALSALGPDGSVLSRIRRLVQGRTAPTFSEGFLAACVVLGGLVLLTSAVALADPRPAAGADSDGGSLARLPFLDAAADTTRKKREVPSEFVIPEAELLKPMPLREEVAAEASVAVAQEMDVAVEIPEVPAAPLAFASAQDDDDDDKGKKRRKRTQQVVVVQEPRRGRPGTVVIEKDKKGRITNLTVDGEQVDTGSTSKKKSKGTARQVEVIRVPAHGGNWSNNFRFDDNFTRSFKLRSNGESGQHFTFRGPDAGEVIRLRRDAERISADARRMLRENPQWRVEIDRSRDFWSDDHAQARVRALQGAERSLQHTLRDADLSAEQRRQVSEQLVLIQKQRQDAREDLRQELAEGRSLSGGAEQRAEEAADRAREAEMRRHEAEMRRLDGEMRRHESDMRRHESEMRRIESEGRRRESNETEEALRRELRKDGLIKDENNFQFSLNTTSLTVNGKKQSAALRDKYLALVEKQTGRKLGPKSTFGINRQISSNTTVQGQVAPPRPPRAPRAPLAPSAPSVPAPPAPNAPLPPAPPKAPSANSDEVRAELRKDGLLGATEKAYQLQLNESGLTVNGQKQSAELAEKYRRLLDVPASNGGKTRSNIQISVSE
ncbi:M56 family metallopeptidase [Hymenobacter glacieicola]|uniref:Peptidase M56 domain-containing protein n=1 Tax=Hymenobacter glacieicola TaxID=1562124 RepID=A0ABQ1WJ27_9BACT|nr:M56 family metallopeptidase [Hymenobacter glacieicola]GGG32156.1 hypothetical protein GCM10011378_05830 [Hymenobacter glacieicola]